MSSHGTMSAAPIAAIAALAILGVAIPVHAAQRTFVATTGNDGNACSISAPCRGFAAAIAKTDVDGEIVVLDSGGYGGLTIAKSVTIAAPAGVYAGISVFAGDGITVTAGALKVVLRGLTINGQGGDNGIRVQGGFAVHIENVVIANLTGAGIRIDSTNSVRLSGVVSRSNATGLAVTPSAGNAYVLVRDSEFSNNLTGINVAPQAAGAMAKVIVERSSVWGNQSGVTAVNTVGVASTVVVTQTVVSENNGGVTSDGAGASVYVRDSTISRNLGGLVRLNSGVLNACGSNLLVDNTTGIGAGVTVNAAACLDQVAGGTVTNIATGPGLTGGPITTTGTIGLAATQLLPTTACAASQIPQWSGAAWTCGSPGGTGTVTSVGTGAGLTGGPITTSGTINLATTQLLPTVACTTNYVPKWTGSAWACALDANSGGTVTSITAGAGLTGGTITTSGTIAVDPTSSTLTGTFFRQGGNAFTTTAKLGTTDNNAVEIYANGARVMRYEPNAYSPNVVGGYMGNSAFDTYVGQTIAGGGKPGNNCLEPSTGTNTRSCANSTKRQFATVGGGESNMASGYAATVAGGVSNTASGDFYATVGGGVSNTASYIGATVAGGWFNTASGNQATVAGGESNTASGGHATVAGGYQNIASGESAIVAGGFLNAASGDYSFAAGRRAKATNQGCFAWADTTAADFTCNVNDGFFVRANGGARFQGAGHWDVMATEGDLRIGNDSYRMKFGVAYTGNAGDAYIGVDGGTEHLTLWTPGGTTVYTSNPATTGVYVASGSGTWSAVSDRAAKRDIAAANGRAVLDKVAELPVYTWRYSAETSGALHMGPVAQDFSAAFGLGDSDKAIATVDADGVALAAIQGLNAKVDEQARVIESLRAELSALVGRLAEVESLRGELAALSAAVAGMVPPTEVATAAP